MESAMGKINFLRRGLISILVGSFVLGVGVALYFILNAGTTFLYVILGFSVPFFFIGSLLLRWHFANRKRKRQEPSSQIT
jgi:peptidoglycan/LPS O-acetylase OafA/YrhL